MFNAIEAARGIGCFFCKFLSANDTGANGSHQTGVYLNMSSWDIFFEGPIPNNEIKSRKVKINFNDETEFESRLVYYSSKKEFRITRFWTNIFIPHTEMVGALILFIPMHIDEYKVYIFNTEEEIEEFIETFSLSLAENHMTYYENDETIEKESFELIIKKLIHGYDHFPASIVMSDISRKTFMEYHHKNEINPDSDLVNWVDTEYDVFKMLEKQIYKEYITEPFNELQPLLDFANSALNRRKSRAGRSLEHHVNYIFKKYKLPFDNPGKTEGRKKPDFLLPSTEDYQNSEFPAENLILVGAKTTCKDRWRQVLSEGERVERKHLITLQQGISENQLEEMEAANLQLVVPKPYHKQYPKSFKDKIWTVQQFIDFAQDKYIYMMS
ncbi:hypothetical protein AAT16_10165 [Salinicoccus halodurans]|uniref:Restriction endonuclease n=1 Tax=Salinicoccus halodurans TaxID=407035 RepID=A0ABM5TBX3_9STAP|nr:hypothetical protein AAT16_10165 [Salinicoccus halodurans]